MTAATLTIQVHTRVRNIAWVRLGVWALSRVGRWMEPKALERRINWLLGKVVPEVKLGTGPWERVTSISLVAGVVETEPKDGWKTFKPTGERKVTLTTGDHSHHSEQLHVHTQNEKNTAPDSINDA